MVKKYFKPKSLTWIAGAALVAYGLITKDYTTVGEGLALIGLRGAIK